MMKNISIISSKERYDEALELFENIIKLYKFMGYEMHFINF